MNIQFGDLQIVRHAIAIDHGQIDRLSRSNKQIGIGYPVNSASNSYKDHAPIDNRAPKRKFESAGGSRLALGIHNDFGIQLLRTASSADQNEYDQNKNPDCA